jgi:phosphoribosyl 1,2-cyclic phosphodiesterase
VERSTERMIITFLGTRGELDIRSRAHHRHSALALETREGIVMIDCGLDWSNAVWTLAPEGIVLTHAHEDHAGGLCRGSPCPVYGTAVTLAAIARFGIAEQRVVEHRAQFELAGLTFEAYPVEHSLRAPAVGYRVTSGSSSLFYVPDLVEIRDRAEALAGIELYVGDGASRTRGIIRARNGARIGHASIREQLGWCAAEGVARAIFTHCGSALVRGDGRTMAARVRSLGRAAGVEAAIARDGLRLELGASRCSVP